MNPCIYRLRKRGRRIPLFQARVRSCLNLGSMQIMFSIQSNVSLLGHNNRKQHVSLCGEEMQIILHGRADALESQKTNSQN